MIVFYGCVNGSILKAMNSLNFKINVCINYSSKVNTIPKTADKVSDAGFITLG